MTFNQRFYIIFAAVLIAIWSTVIGMLTWGVIGYFNGSW